jgi:hypothetical protein
MNGTRNGNQDGKHSHLFQQGSVTYRSFKECFPSYVNLILSYIQLYRKGD